MKGTFKYTEDYSVMLHGSSFVASDHARTQEEKPEVGVEIGQRGRSCILSLGVYTMVWHWRAVGIIVGILSVLSCQRC